MEPCPFFRRLGLREPEADTSNQRTVGYVKGRIRMDSSEITLHPPTWLDEVLTDHDGEPEAMTESSETPKLGFI